MHFLSSQIIIQELLRSPGGGKTGGAQNPRWGEGRGYSETGGRWGAQNPRWGKDKGVLRNSGGNKMGVLRIPG